VDNLVLIRVVQAIDAAFVGAILRDIRVESAQRYRLAFEAGGRRPSLIVSLRPELPWIGRPAGGWSGPRMPRDPLAARALRSLAGTGLVRASRPPNDRSVTLAFSSGDRLIVELVTHGANLVLVDRSGRVVAAARRPRSSRGRLEPGQPYRPAEPPRSLIVPARATAEAVDALLERRAAEGEAACESLRRGVFGVGPEGAHLLVEEGRRDGLSVGRLLFTRLDELRRGLLAPVVLAPEDPADPARHGALDPKTPRLLPWPPARIPEGLRIFVGDDAAATAGLYHDPLERSVRLRERVRALRSILAREIERGSAAARRVAADLAAFDDPERFRHWGEALLAGIGRARVVGSGAVVPDPYDTEQREIVVPIEPGRSLQHCAQGYFRRHRRALRGAQRARRRGIELAERGERLRRLLERTEVPGGPDLERLERRMREEGIPVGLEPPTRAGRAAALARRPRREGVRLLTSSDGWTILVGRSGRNNHRLTFDLAGPEDFWLHAQGCPGAHVVLRNATRSTRPPVSTLREAAAAAAWFSDARNQGRVDVQWTRRKYVRHPRGAAPGTVVLKRFETVRVRPGLPPGEGERSAPNGRAGD